MNRREYQSEEIYICRSCDDPPCVLNVTNGGGPPWKCPYEGGEYNPVNWEPVNDAAKSFMPDQGETK